MSALPLRCDVRQPLPTEGELVLVADQLATFAKGTWPWERVHHLELPVPMTPLTPLEGDGTGVPIDFILQSSIDYTQLYHCHALHEHHPLRISMVAGVSMERAVKLCTALGFPLRLVLEQPDEATLGALNTALELYLYNEQCEQPIEPFHSLLLTALHPQTPPTLWQLCEQPGTPPVEPAGECSACPFWSRCQGYFKQPTADYACTGVRQLLSSLDRAAQELASDLDRAST